MGKLILLGVGVFLTVGILLEHMLDTVFSPEAEAEFNDAANRFLAAQQEGEAIPANPQPRDERTQTGSRQLSMTDCSAASIAPFTPHPEMDGTVTKVVDGDTLRVAVDGVEMKIRLWGIDAPEMDQELGERSQRELQAMIPEGSRATIHPLSMDRYGRVVGNVGGNSEWSVNFRMVAQGWAYHYQEFSAKNNRCFMEAERLARDSRTGVWQGGAQGQDRPWDHRRKKQENQPQDRTSA